MRVSHLDTDLISLRGSDFNLFDDQRLVGLPGNRCPALYDLKGDDIEQTNILIDKVEMDQVFITESRMVMRFLMQTKADSAAPKASTVVVRLPILLLFIFFSFLSGAGSSLEMAGRS